jgi:uncharacterized protein (DUF302 family)
VGDAVFVGDTLFMPDYGTARADFPGGDACQLYRSIRKLLSLPPEARLFMCHDYKGPARDHYAWETTVRAQRENNVHVRDAEDEFVATPTARDSTLPAPAGEHPRRKIPPAEANGAPSCNPCDVQDGNRGAGIVPRPLRLQPGYVHANYAGGKIYYFAKTLTLPFDEAVRRTVEALKEGGFGIITEIDVRDAFKQKLDVDFRRYRILGACNPALAYGALQLEDKVGTMLPCNVIVQEINDGKSEVAAIDPIASMQAIDNPRLKEIAQRVAGMLKAIVEAL